MKGIHASEQGKKIEELGKKLVNCDIQCEGVTNDKPHGIIPRYLILEERRNTKGVIVVGINPGRASSKEKQYLKDSLKHSLKHSSYYSVKEYWEKNHTPSPYYNGLRGVADSLGFKGSILWTELAKCELKEGVKTVPLQTLRTCIDKYLKKELKLFNHLPIIAAGNQAFEYCSLTYPRKLVIGIPHPRGYGTFYKVVDKVSNRLKKDYLKRFEEAKQSSEFPAIRLFPKGNSRINP